jgi:hypothetical protein
MLAPLLDLVRECGETTTTKKINQEKSLEVRPDSSRGIDNVKATIAKEVV